MLNMLLFNIRYLKGPMSLGPYLAALFVLFIALQLLIKAKMNRVVVDMTNNFFLESVVDIVGHLAAISGSAFVTAAMAP
ncbi:hypothetical protein [Cytobacillus firmus]|uniref:hypothetical protein n=1 Tax=Cytobacillus firmus TaxID=1399 RepID=UPI001C8CF969|nr:hypothetical protein [Cytobacillus firmus]